jgi:hypothetical protein
MGTQWTSLANYTQRNLGLVILLLKFFIFSSEPFDTPGRIDELLFSRKKRMAL